MDNGPEPPEVGPIETTGKNHQNSTPTHQPMFDSTDRAIDQIEETGVAEATTAATNDSGHGTSCGHHSRQ